MRAQTTWSWTAELDNSLCRYVIDSEGHESNAALAWIHRRVFLLLDWEIATSLILSSSSPLNPWYLEEKGPNIFISYVQLTARPGVHSTSILPRRSFATALRPESSD